MASQAIALLGRIHEARLEPAEALAYYRRIDGRVPDAAEAVEALTAKSLRVPEVSVVRPRGRDAKPGVPGAAAANPPALSLDVTCRNLAELDVRVYPVDLLRLFPGRDDLGAVASVDLAGIRPVHQAKVAVGDGKTVDLSASASAGSSCRSIGEGAYLVMLRGDDRFASGLVVLTPMELEVTPSPETGRMRIAVRNARTRRGVPGAQVKVIGSRTPAVQAGRDRPPRRVRRRRRRTAGSRSSPDPGPRSTRSIARPPRTTAIAPRRPPGDGLACPGPMIPTTISEP